MKHTRKRALLVAVLLATGVAGIAGGVLAPAASAETAPQILVSADGVHYSATLSANLFDGLGALIPGGSQAATLWVKNPTSSPVAVRLSASDVRAAATDFAASVTMTSSNSHDPLTRSHLLSTLQNCEVLVDSKALAAAESIAMTVTFTMADVGARVAQDEHAALNLRVGMRDEAAGAFPESACDDSGVVIGPTPDPTATPEPTPTPDPTATATSPTAARGSGPLAHTGFDGATPLLVVGGLIAGGVFFFIVGRRRTRDRR